MKQKISLRELLTFFKRKFEKGWEEKYSEPCFFRWTNKDLEKMLQVIRGFSVAEISKRIKNFFDDERDWFKKTKHSHRIFLESINELGEKYEKKATPKITSLDEGDIEIEKFRKRTAKYGFKSSSPCESHVACKFPAE